MLVRMQTSSGGGGNSYDFGKAPDKIIRADTAGTSGTTSVQVTQKPRLIVMTLWSRDNNYTGALGIIDVEANKAFRAGYWSSAGHDFTEWSNWSAYFPTVSDSQVVYNIATYQIAHRAYIAIYY